MTYMCDFSQEDGLTPQLGRGKDKSPSMLALYLSYHAKYTEKYGTNTVVLCQVGDFFEMYAVINEQEERGPNIYRMGDMLGIQVTRRNKSIPEVSDSNYLMAGFPLGALPKHTQALVNNGYTAVIVRQVSPPPNVKREVTEVISSSTTLTPGNAEPNYLMVIMASLQNGRWVCGMSGVDVSTGASMVYEVGSTLEDPSRALDEVVRVLHACPSREIVLLSDHSVPVEARRRVETVAGGAACVHALWDTFPECFHKRAYQEAILAKAGIGRGILSAHSISGLEGMPLASVALCYMIQFAHEHNPKLVTRLQAPQVMTQQNRLVLQYNSAQQLNILGTGLPNEMPLLALLNRTVTSPGSRLFRDRLLNPITCQETLTARYDRVALYLQDNLYQSVRKALKGVLDLERMVRRMSAEVFAPCDWPTFHMTLLAGLSVAELVQDGIGDTIHRVMEGYRGVIELEEASKYALQDIRGNVFHKGVHPDLDKLMDTIQQSLDEIVHVARVLSNQEDARMCKVECNDRDGYFITTTKKRWEAIQEAAKRIAPGHNLSSYTVKPISHGSNTLRITCDRIDKASGTIIRTQKTLASLTQERYIAFLFSFVERHAEDITAIAHSLADIDVQATNAANARDFGYTRPVLAGPGTGTEAGAFVDAKQLRHPIIESIQKRVDYVANDVRLDAGRQGLLLYGVNASGKSSLMKAIGLAVIMAQSGMYVACGGLTLAPYHNIFTRISGDDNLYQGMSSFAVEMTELRNILVRADRHSLVLGDELCSGTEAVSAVSIVAAGIGMLMGKRATYVFATHLHELLDIPEVKEHTVPGRLHIAHMHTEARDGAIIYDRTLRDGPGESTYGIEVCRGLGMPHDFMALAEKIRRRVQQVDDGFVRQKASRYNARVNMDTCGVCREEMATETHHIRYQHTADEEGFVMGGDVRVHKNAVSNLVPLCSRCHAMEHSGSLKIHGWRQTTGGVELDYTQNHTQQTENSTEAGTEAETEAGMSTEDMAHVWRPYVRYTRNGWMVRKKLGLRSRFKPVSMEELLKTLGGIQEVPTCLVPSVEDLERLQTHLLDVSL